MFSVREIHDESTTLMVRITVMMLLYLGWLSTWSEAQQSWRALDNNERCAHEAALNEVIMTGYRGGLWGPSPVVALDLCYVAGPR
nr:hypothetical protein CFP56_63775 [Quercus suber]